MKIIPNNKVIYKFQHEMEYVETISPGEIVKFETNDCWFQQITNENQVVKEINYEILNPATGPIYIEGAEPGDLLQVKILNIDVEDKGSSVVVPNEGV